MVPTAEHPDSTHAEERAVESVHETAIVNAIIIENRSLKMHLALLAKVNDVRSKLVLELLAVDGAGQLESFCNLFADNEDELINTLIDNSIYADPYCCSLFDSVDGGSAEIDALLIALREEQICIRRYSECVETIQVPHIRDVFVRILNETHKHCEMILEEYMRLMNMVAGTGPDSFMCE